MTMVRAFTCLSATSDRGKMVQLLVAGGWTVSFLAEIADTT